ncbi:hypothetical protein M378DRAFT_9131 [Amanita muscaria Koide BX008]|uniref:Uncharacterized protein n=1 Tax=Amanita muscaria (strain Koide BX008) TaxID=946122 RepID=A0A0C2XEL0_AMAMK|nr:hypothetical protein M378DRAFT_9131 [Amanita muscaria Koide BX008]
MNVKQAVVTQLPNVQFEGNSEDPLAELDDKINEQTISALGILYGNELNTMIATKPVLVARAILKTIISIVNKLKKSDFLDGSYMTDAMCASLFENDKELPGRILDAWEKQDFKPIRTLPILQKNPPDEDISMAEIPDNTLATASAFKEATEDSWTPITPLPSAQLEVNLEDPLAEHNDQINGRILSHVDLLQQYETNTDPKNVAHLTLQAIIFVLSRYKENSLDASYLMDAERALLFERDETLPGRILDALKQRDFKPIRTLSILQKNPPDEDISMAVIPDNTSATTQAFKEATEQSWNRPFEGYAVSALWEHILHYYNDKQTWYANYVAMVQSSGTGKSRTIDELSKTRFTIPLCLRVKGNTGYPYADDEVRDFLTLPNNENDAHLHALTFLLALFEHTKTILESEFHEQKHSAVAASFREYMITSRGSSPRRTFFQAVVEKAKAYVKQSHITTPGSIIRCFSLVDRGINQGKVIDKVHLAWTSLAGLLAKMDVSSLRRPILLIAWDEAHTLTNKGSPDHLWSHFIALRRVLGELKHHPIFSIFSSTTSSMSQFSPASANDDSNRVVDRELQLIHPFCDFGFDLLVTTKVYPDAGQSLDEFTTDKYMCHLGRPLFGSHYDYGDAMVQENLLLFAAMKLVRNAKQIPPPSKLSSIQRIACLSFRLPIQFNSTTYSRKDDESLVEGHMRICLKVDISREFMNTLSASEPFMSEAAYFVANRSSLAEGRKVAVEAFKQLTEGFAIHTGDRGEFLALLLCTLARDSTVGLPDDNGQPCIGKRYFGLADFLCNNLIHETLASTESKANLHRLRLDFPDAVLHFNHFIKAHEQSVIDQMNLLLLMARGAGYFCANCQPGVDFILPFLVNNLQIAMENSGLILVQVKNDWNYGASIQQRLFDIMNPYQLDILKDNVAPPPMIRIVFALASATPLVHVNRSEPSNEYNNIIYDIWIAGITPNVLRPIDPNLQDTWKALLQASYGWKNLFQATGYAKRMRMSTDAASAQGDGHWDSWSGRAKLRENQPTL